MSIYAGLLLLAFGFIALWVDNKIDLDKTLKNWRDARKKRYNREYPGQ